MKRLLEICSDSIHSAIQAEAGGADRVELCDNLAQGGVTPSGGKIKLVSQKLKIPVYVLVRPRSADFLYSTLEFELMLEDIRHAKQHGAKGIVSGILERDGNIDLLRTKKLIEAAYPLPFTFHRAFDMTRQPLKSLEQLKELGVKRVLTSGQQASAPKGKSLIQKLVQQAEKDITILAGGGIKPGNIDELLAIDGLVEFHASARHLVQSKMLYLGEVAMGSGMIKEEFQWLETDRKIVSALKKKIQ